MNCTLRLFLGSTMCLVLWAGSASAEVTVPTTEDFATSAANWRDVGSVALTYVAAGGPDGNGYVTTSLPLTGLPPNGVILFRGQKQFNSSNQAFVGDWLGAGVGTLTAYVRHNASQPLSIFARIAGEFNNPGVDIELPTLIPPNTWTQMTFNLSPTNPKLTVEGPPSAYTTVFQAVGNLQIGVALLRTCPIRRPFSLTWITFRSTSRSRRR